MDENKYFGLILSFYTHYEFTQEHVAFSCVVFMRRPSVFRLKFICAFQDYTADNKKIRRGQK